MPRKILRHYIPSPARIREIRSLQLLGDWIYDPSLWHITRHSASMAFFVGLFVAFIPVPGQMVVAAILAVRLRCNLPLAVGLVWITNPLTMPAIFYLSYKIGALIIDVPMQEMVFDLSFRWITHSLGSIWQPMLLGCVICGTFFGSLGYFLISVIWRWRVSVRWKKRKLARVKRHTR